MREILRELITIMSNSDDLKITYNHIFSQEYVIICDYMFWASYQSHINHI
jgi:hypothetical protein